MLVFVACVSTLLIASARHCLRRSADGWQQQQLRINLFLWQALQLFVIAVIAFDWLARGDWDGFSDVDLLAIALTASQANNLADALLGNGIADDVIALTQADWQ